MEPEEVDHIARTAVRLQENIERVIVGKGDVVALVLRLERKQCLH